MTPGPAFLATRAERPRRQFSDVTGCVLPFNAGFTTPGHKAPT